MRTSLEIHKFGGTSLEDADRIAASARLAARAARRCRVVVVASAGAGVTAELIRIASLAAAGDSDAARRGVSLLEERHRRAAEQLGDGRDGADVVAATGVLCGELGDLVRATAYLGELTPRTCDRILAAGEKLSVRLVALALRVLGLDAAGLDADGFLETDDRFGNAQPLGEIADRHIVAAIGPVLERGAIPVVTGFCGRAPDGATTTLGRGASDFTATLLARALDASAVTLWSDVDGVYSADPRVVPEARVLRQLNYREAGEMSYYGAEVLHQRTMIPVVERRIPVAMKNSMNPEAPGTAVDGRFTPGSHPVKAVSAVRDQALVSVEGKGMSGVPGIAARVFGALAAEAISVTMISQSSSESSICLAIPGPDAASAEQALKRALRTEISRGDIEEIVVRRAVGLVAAVGLGMAQTPGVAARLFKALGQRRINVLAIAQGSSEVNVTLAVAAGDVDDALRGIHSEFGLERLDTGLDATHHLDLLLLGCGGIGRELIEQVLDRRSGFFDRFGLHPRVVAVCDRSGYHFRPQGIDLDDLRRLLAAKASGEPLVGLEGGTAGTGRDMIAAAGAYRLARPVLVDVSDSSDSGALFEEAFAARCDVATANKKPLAGSRASYERLMAAARDRRRFLRAEATVGAGLPIVETLDMLLQTGDRLVEAEGSLSGTLGFLMTRLEEGAPFSRAVAEAIEQGYTEPDPAEDLSGGDVARKALILGRLSGLVADEGAVDLVGLVDGTWNGLATVDLLERIGRELDGSMADRVAAAGEAGRVLRFVARVRAGRIDVGPVEVEASSPLAQLRGTDNQIVLRSERYDARPLVITGPGAGVEVTAMGLLGDILRIAAERA